jgi:hypothetical protein
MPAYVFTFSSLETGRRLAAALCAVVTASATMIAAGQPQAQSMQLGQLMVPTTHQGMLDDKSQHMPLDVDSGAKGGPADKFEFTLDEPAKLWIRLECDTCLHRLVVLDSAGKVIKRASAIVEGPLVDLTLKPGRYSIWAGTVAGRGGAYTLTVSNEPLELTQPTFRRIDSTYQAGAKTVQNYEDALRIGTHSITVQEHTTGRIIKTFKTSEIEAVETSTTSTSNAATAMLLGPAFAGSSHQNWIKIRTATDYIILDVEAKYLQVILSELQRATAQK